MLKYIIPVIIVVIILIFLVLQGLGVLAAPALYLGGGIFKFLFIGIIVCLGIALIVVLIQRIKEIKEDDKDDLGKY